MLYDITNFVDCYYFTNFILSNHHSSIVENINQFKHNANTMCLYYRKEWDLYSLVNASLLHVQKC